MRESGPSPLEYRQALGCFATGVIVVTAIGPGGPTGLTINSFTSVSLAPRLVLWCLDCFSERGQIFLETPRFGLNVLAAGQRDLAVRFAEPGSNAWPNEAARTPDASGLQLEGGLAFLDCRAVQRIELGDHIVLVGEVEAFSARGGDGLTYYQGRYGCAPGQWQMP
jgi:flavin reductase (DIM6/NTAB) family NADH-FMN oxidoreductase RutF